MFCGDLEGRVDKSMVVFFLGYVLLMKLFYLFMPGICQFSDPPR